MQSGLSAQPTCQPPWGPSFNIHGWVGWLVYTLSHSTTFLNCRPPVVTVHGGVQMVCMLVAAGADVNVKVKPSCPHEGDTTIAALLFHTVKDKPSQHPAKQILQVLIGEPQTMPPGPLSAPAWRFGCACP